MVGVGALLGLLSMAAALGSATAGEVQGSDAALRQDAAEYARQFAVPLEEAELRLRAQEQSVAITDQIQQRYQDRLAGIAIEHKPDWHILVYLTGDAPVPDRQVVLAGLTVPILFRTGAKATREQVVRAISYHQAELRAALPAPPAMGLDPRTGELVVVLDKAIAAQQDAEALRAKLEAIAGVPVRIDAIDRKDVNLDLVGGSRVAGMNEGKRYYCTSGFVVTDGVRQGLTTAAHCPDTLTYYDPQRVETPLDFVGQWGWGYHDVQIHTAAAPMQPWFYADTARTTLRPVTGARSRDSTRVGDFVCHRGESSGYSCALVELVDFAPAGDLCGGACLPTWVAVAGPGCKPGDSGGPVFIGTTALGILKGASYLPDKSCAFYFYMSVDYLPPPWRLLEER